MALKLRELPAFPPYQGAQTDHDFMQAASAAGPFAKDKLGILNAFSAAHIALLSDERWT